MCLLTNDLNEEIQIGLAGTISWLNDATSLDFDDLFVTLRRKFTVRATCQIA